MYATSPLLQYIWGWTSIPTLVRSTSSDPIHASWKFTMAVSIDLLKIQKIWVDPTPYSKTKSKSHDYLHNKHCQHCPRGSWWICNGNVYDIKKSNLSCKTTTHCSRNTIESMCFFQDGHEHLKTRNSKNWMILLKWWFGWFKWMILKIGMIWVRNGWF